VAGDGAQRWLMLLARGRLTHLEHVDEYVEGADGLEDREQGAPHALPWR